MNATSIVTATLAATTKDELLKGVSSMESELRTAAWLRAGDVGAPAIAPLIDLAATAEVEIARAARRGLEKLVRHAGRPGADKERAAVSLALLKALDSPHPAQLRRDLLSMISEICGDEAVAPVASLLSDTDVREDARLALERIPGQASVVALKKALDTTPADFQIQIAQSLRARGENVQGHPCVKLVPTKETEVGS